MITRIISAIFYGLLAAAITFVVLLVLNRVLQTPFDPSFWALIIGVLVGLYAFLTNKTIAL